MTHFDLLTDAEFGKRLPQHNWAIKGHYIKREALHIDDIDSFIKRYDKQATGKKREKLEKDIKKNPLAYLRTLFLRENFMHDLDHNGHAIHKIQDCGSGWQALEKTGALRAVECATLPQGSAVWTLTFQLLTPLLTADDDPFYLFDNPLRKDHTFGVPYLSAAAIKGLAADAYQRSFPGQTPWIDRGQDDPERTRHFRQEDAHAARLFGVSTNDDQADSLRGRMHFSPLWLRWVQYVVMNPINPETGTGSQPIHFEAAAAEDNKGKPVTLTLHGFYVNPLGIAQSDSQTVYQDLARFFAALATCWPQLGLGAKRLAGYGAIEPKGIQVQTGTKTWKQDDDQKSWLDVAEQLAKAGQ